MIRPLILTAAFAAALSACSATLGPDQCRQGDWNAIGMADGMEGRAEASLQHHVNTCSTFGVFPDVEAYRKGRAEGIKLYCVPETAYSRGRSGLSFPAVCSGASAEAIRPAYDFGRRYWDLGMEIDYQRRSLREDAREGSLLPSDAALVPGQIRRLQAEQRRYAVWPPR